MPDFGTVLLGAPGSGKTTACNGLQQFFSLTKRDCAVINIDPANDILPYKCDVDIAELITLRDVIQEYGFGPNGGLIYCMEYLEKNMDWLLGRLEGLKGKYLIFDCPGQVELYTHNNAMRNILRILEKHDFRLCIVHMVDAHLCTDAPKYISSLLLSLKTMLHLSQPHINVLSKIDLIQTYGSLAFNLDFYTEVQDLSYLLESLNNSPDCTPRFAKLNAAVCELVEEFGIVGYTTLCVEDKRSVKGLIDQMDRANGYFGKDEEEGSMLWAVGSSNYLKYFDEIQDIQERYIGMDAEKY
ncbi:GPN-loop GTPase 2 [Physocladia obscura]|uniref:GPN-loop GTPase 2 n=1 Tax=Physocladia obscura TaxID=109957 RepID=A0AAD5XH45_9FUNG|nr:GPN-loop GTPase 2 [Physocladia obscura]